MTHLNKWVIIVLLWLRFKTIYYNYNYKIVAWRQVINRRGPERSHIDHSYCSVCRSPSVVCLPHLPLAVSHGRPSLVWLGHPCVSEGQCVSVCVCVCVCVSVCVCVRPRHTEHLAVCVHLYLSRKYVFRALKPWLTRAIWEAGCCN